MTGGSAPASPAPRSWTPSTGCSAGPGVILVAEGVPARVRGLLAQEKKKVARIVGDTPIYDIIVGDEEGQIPLRKLSAHVMKLPRNLTGGRAQRARPPDERHGWQPDAGARWAAARRQADVGQPAPGPPPSTRSSRSPATPGPTTAWSRRSWSWPGGGPAATAAVALARAGIETYFVGAVGDDDVGRQIRTGLEQEGVDVSELAVTSGARSPQSTILVGGETARSSTFAATPASS